MKNFEMAVAFFMGVIFTGLCFAFSSHNINVKVTIDEPLVARLDVKSHPLGELVGK